MPRTLCSLSPSLSAFLSGSANGDSNTRTQIQLRYVAHTNLPGISASLYWTTDWLSNEFYSLQSTVYSWHSLQSSFFCSCSAFSYSLNLCFRAFSWHCLGHVRGPIWDLLVAESRLGQLGHNIYAVCVPGLPFGFSFLLFELWLWLCLCLTVLLVWKNDAVAQIRCLLKVEFRASPIVVGLIKLARR